MSSYTRKDLSAALKKARKYSKIRKYITGGKVVLIIGGLIASVIIGNQLIQRNWNAEISEKTYNTAAVMLVDICPSQQKYFISLLSDKKVSNKEFAQFKRKCVK